MSEGERKVQNLVFVERLDLITWLEGASDESEYIRPLAGDVIAPVPTAGGGGGGAAATAAAATDKVHRAARVVDARLQEIYNGERKMGDRNTVLRGIKPTVSHAPRPKGLHIH